MTVLQTVALPLGYAAEEQGIYPPPPGAVKRYRATHPRRRSLPNSCLRKVVFTDCLAPVTRIAGNVRAARRTVPDAARERYLMLSA